MAAAPFQADVHAAVSRSRRAGASIRSMNCAGTLEERMVRVEDDVVAKTLRPLAPVVRSHGVIVGTDDAARGSLQPRPPRHQHQEPWQAPCTKTITTSPARRKSSVISRYFEPQANSSLPAGWRTFLPHLVDHLQEPLPEGRVPHTELLNQPLVQRRTRRRAPMARTIRHSNIFRSSTRKSWLGMTSQFRSSIL